MAVVTGMTLNRSGLIQFTLILFESEIKTQADPSPAAQDDISCDVACT
jgi:hypothetical protein